MPEDRKNKVSCNSYVYELEVAFEILSGKWVPQIVWILSTNGTQRFGQLKRKMPSITQKMLTQQLRHLEKYGIVNRKVYPKVPPVVEYSLTEIAQKLIPLLKELNSWSEEYLELRNNKKNTKV